MGSIASIDIVSNGDNMCSKCGMKEKKGGCCRDEVRFYKFEKSFKASNSVFVPQQLIESVPLVLPNYDFTVFSSSDRFCDPVISDSPDPSGPPIYLRNRVFRL